MVESIWDVFQKLAVRGRPLAAAVLFVAGGCQSRTVAGPASYPETVSHGRARFGRDVAVPSSCNAMVNRGLAELIASGTRQDVDNVMVCGVAAERTRFQRPGRYGPHHLTTINAPLPDGETVRVQVVTNDDLDGVVTANAGDPVFAYGQAYLAHGYWVAGVHDVHCSTHASADNGWIVVAGVKRPEDCPAR